MRGPHVGSLQRPLSAFLGAGKGTDVKYVMVNGEIVFREGDFTKFKDSKEILSSVERLASEIISKAGLASRLDMTWKEKCPPISNPRASI
jgi:5-methylthioadenosine/S-adenosylhomocysteine deaminase